MDAREIRILALAGTVLKAAEPVFLKDVFNDVVVRIHLRFRASVPLFIFNFGKQKSQDPEFRIFLLLLVGSYRNFQYDQCGTNAVNVVHSYIVMRTK